MLKESGSSFPPEFVSYCVLPCLASAFEFGGASAATIVPLILQFGKNVAPDDCGSIIVAPLVKLFASADRGTRIALLDSLPDFAEKLDKKTVVDKIWPNLVCVFHPPLECSSLHPHLRSKLASLILSLSFEKQLSGLLFYSLPRYVDFKLLTMSLLMTCTVI